MAAHRKTSHVTLKQLFQLSRIFCPGTRTHFRFGPTRNIHTNPHPHTLSRPPLSYLYPGPPLPPLPSPPSIRATLTIHHNAFCRCHHGGYRAHRSYGSDCGLPREFFSRFLLLMVSDVCFDHIFVTLEPCQMTRMFSVSTACSTCINVTHTFIGLISPLLTVRRFLVLPASSCRLLLPPLNC